ncbi:MAG: DUF4349 domain-containing protein [Flavobacteriales bacterium]
MKHLLPLLPFLFLLACGHTQPEAMRWSEDAAMAAPASAAGGLEQRNTTVDRKIIRTGDIRFEVMDLDAARTMILEQVQEHGGHVEGDDRMDMGSAMAMTLRVRIPANAFDAFLARLKGVGEVQDQRISANDVTAQWVDVEARLAAKRKVEQRFLTIVDQARTVTEVLEVERELGNVRAEIKSMTAQMKSLQDQVGMSTLTITCLKPVARNDRYTPHFGLALQEGWNMFVQFLVGLLHLWPFLLLFGGLTFWLVRRRRAKK